MMSVVSSKNIVEIGNEKIIYFTSASAGNSHLLSNLNYAPVTLEKGEDGLDALYLLNPDVSKWLEALGEPGSTGSAKLTFPTIEHLWHALKATEKATFLQFAEGGRFARFDTDAFSMLMTRDDAARKFAYWARKDNWGIIPKLVSNAKNCSRLMLNGKMDYAREMPNEAILVNVWTFLLRKKYTNNEAHRKALLESGRTTTLVEMSRMAAVRPQSEFWGGYSKDGCLYGRNFMGEMMQRCREEFFSKT